VDPRETRARLLAPPGIPGRKRAGGHDPAACNAADPFPGVRVSGPDQAPLPAAHMPIAATISLCVDVSETPPPGLMVNRYSSSCRSALVSRMTSRRSTRRTHSPTLAVRRDRTGPSRPATAGDPLVAPGCLPAIPIAAVVTGPAIVTVLALIPEPPGVPPVHGYSPS
jgi:hypothetical protein